MGKLITRRTRALRFHSTSLTLIRRDGDIWLRASQIGSALGYAKGGGQSDTPFRELRRLYERHAAEFTDRMTQLVTLQTKGGPQEVRVFSLRGAHLLAMFARTERAAEFRRWVLDVLDGQATPMPPAPPPAGQPHRGAPPLAPPPVSISNDLPDALRALLNRHAFALSHAAYEELRTWLIDSAAFKYRGGNGVWASVEYVQDKLSRVGLGEWQVAYHAKRVRALRLLVEAAKGLTAEWAEQIAARCAALEPELNANRALIRTPTGAAITAAMEFGFTPDSPLGGPDGPRLGGMQVSIYP